MLRVYWTYVHFYITVGGVGGGQRCMVCEKEQNPSIQVHEASL